MAEPKTLEEALEWYEANRFSRKSLFKFVVDRLKATEGRVTALEEQNRQLVTALVRGAQEPPQPSQSGYMTAEQVDASNNAIREDLALVAHARDLGIKVDKRWSAATLKAKIDAANGAMEAAHG